MEWIVARRLDCDRVCSDELGGRMMVSGIVYRMVGG